MRTDPETFIPFRLDRSPPEVDWLNQRTTPDDASDPGFRGARERGKDEAFFLGKS
jgi:hypothetical protein